ncbi:MAG: MFS transporter [Candidatus Zixiibacteriota bacterium]
MTHAQPASLWRRDIVAWSLYDFANTIYSMNIVSLYLKRYIVEDLGYRDHYFDIAFSVSMLIAAIVLPALGALSDHSTRKKLFLALFTLSCCMAVGLMSVVPAGWILILLALFVIANFSYEAGLPFYNALLYSVAEGKKARYISGVGVALGYVGSVAGMILVLPFVSGNAFGLTVPFVHGWGKSGAFLPTAVLFLLFALPIFLLVKEKRHHDPKAASIKQAYSDVWRGLRETHKYPGVLRFLIADYFFEDAVATVIINIGIYCSLVIGLTDSQITLFLIVSTISAVFGSFVIGKIAEHSSLKRLLAIIMGGWVIALITFAFTTSTAVIWILGSAVGVLLGGLWTVSRPMLAELVPQDQLGRFFGLFTLSGRAAAVIGPLLWTSVVFLFRPTQPLGSWATQALGLSEVESARLPYKLAVVSLAVLIVIGLWIFRRVPHTQELQHERH